MKLVRIPEKVVQQQIVELLRRLGARVYVIGTKRRRGEFQGTMMSPGIPDLYAVLPALPHVGVKGGGLWVEVKGEGGRLRPEQAQFAAACLEHGIPHVVGGLDAVLRFLVTGGWVKSSSLPHYRQMDAKCEAQR